eukprot:TRINITY_DN30777_c0_g1_i1.p1 TRINITY_DN30777_c0_g1~~TRINITY_DN30777_c0_g1_i1.p1  ORF type:complete len:443 (+),score=164.53 TRINITY_DN30777_c0_g1_i1:81-1331(+)
MLAQFCERGNALCWAAEEDEGPGGGFADPRAEGCSEEQLAELTELQLGDAQLGAAAVAQLARALSADRLSSLTAADFSCAELGGNASCADLVQALAAHAPQLQRLVLSAACRFRDDDEDEPLYLALRDAVDHLPRLAELAVCDTAMTDVACLTICQTMVNASSLTQLGLDWNNLGPLAAESLAEVMRAGHLRSLDLSHNPIGDEGAASLLMMLPHVPRITHLGLQCCQIQLHEDWEQIGDSALESSALRSLRLSRNHLNVGGARRLCRFLPRWRALRALYLRHNYVCCDGAAALAAAVPRCPTLGILDLAENNISDIGAHAISELIATPGCPLLQLDLSANPISDAAAEELLAAAGRGEGVLTALALCGCVQRQDRVTLEVGGGRAVEVDFGDPSDSEGERPSPTPAGGAEGDPSG